MNKDFWKKEISLKDINLSAINWKSIMKKKEVIIGVLILIYIILILVIGSNLLGTRKEALAEYELKEKKYNSLLGAKSEDEIKKQLEEMEIEKGLLAERITSITDNRQVEEVVSELKKGAPITWPNESMTITPGLNTKDFKDYDIYNVNINGYSGTFEQVEAFLEYIDNYNRIVRVDSLTISENKVTGKMGGQLKLSLYFKKSAV